MNLGNLSYFGVFLEGLLSFLSPCVLPLIPLYVGYLSQDADGRQSRRIMLVHTLFFVLGIGTVFVVAALGITFLQDFLSKYQLPMEIAGGILLIAAGLIALGVIRIPALERTYRHNAQRRGGNLGAYLLGFFFSFAWTPCVGPLLGSALVLAANAESHLQGILYIVCYAAGFLLLFVLLGLFTDETLRLLKKYRNVTAVVGKVGGAIVLAMGVYMLVDANRSVVQKTQAPAQETAPAVGEESAGAAAEAEASASPSAPADTRSDIEKYDFTLMDGDGNEVTLSSYKGKTVVLNFFATWCYYCNQELPDFQKVHDNDPDVVVLLVDMPNVSGEGDQDYVMKYMADAGYSMTVLFDTTGSVHSMYGVSGFPTTYVIQPDGNFLGYMPGYMQPSVLEQALWDAKNNANEQ